MVQESVEAEAVQEGAICEYEKASPEDGGAFEKLKSPAPEKDETAYVALKSKMKGR